MPVKLHRWFIVTICVASEFIYNPVNADELNELKKQLELLTEKVELLESQQHLKLRSLPDITSHPSSNNPVMSGDQSGSFRFPDTNISLKLEGYVQTNFIYDIAPRPTSRGGDSASTHAAILKGAPEYNNRGDSRISARDSRFSIETSSPTDIGLLRTFIEADFNGPPNDKSSRATTSRTAFGIRLAYGEIGNLLTGQYWSNFSNNSVFPSKVDGAGPTSRALLRQGQIRYTYRYGNGKRFAVALENPKGDYHGADDSNLDDSFPDLTGHYRYEAYRWHIQFGWLLRSIGINDGLAGVLNDRVTGWGINQSGAFLIPGSHNRISWYLVLGNGLGRYMEGGVNQGASVNPEGELDLQFAYGGFVTYQHWWTETLQSNIDFGVGFQDLNTEEVSDANKKLLSSHINIIWLPVDNMEFGIEYIWGRRVVHDARVGRISRIQLNSIYYF